MSVKSSASSRAKEKEKRKADARRDVARPFGAAIAKQAADIAARYQVVLESERGEWYGRGLEMPHVFADGPTPDHCVTATREAMTAAVAYLLEKGQTPPAPARAGRRTQQVNVRFTCEEKATIESTAHRKGFSGLSDYIRAAALESTTKHPGRKPRGHRGS